MIGNERFLHCRGCNEVHKVTPFDQAPIYELQGSNVREIPTDDGANSWNGTRVMPSKS
ncbi:MAG: hypothetical protein ACXWW4_10040 [Candidatus Binatia bacterium]